MSGLFGLGLPVLHSCASLFTNNSLKPTDRVLIIGAGAAGLSAAYLLHQKGIEVEILEADRVYGGRMKRTTDFANFPIPTGAEWLHTKKSVLADIVNDSSVEIKTVTKPYNPEVDYALIDGKKEKLKKLGFTIDRKFINATWFDFFEQYIVPSIKGKIRFNQVVTSINYSGNQVNIDTNKAKYTADRVIVTVPVKMLQNNAITFTPKLPEDKSKAIQNITVWGGCKAFIEFSEKFYPAATGFESIPIEQGHKLFYDAAYGQNTSQHILGLFAVDPVADAYLKRKGIALIQYILAELDQLFEGKATQYYKKLIFLNWTEAHYAQGAYVYYLENWKNIRMLGKSVEDKLYFAGDAYTNGSTWSSVHAAAQSAKRVVKQLVG